MAQVTISVSHEPTPDTATFRIASESGRPIFSLGESTWNLNSPSYLIPPKKQEGSYTQ